ncbi:MAG: ATP-binding protein [Bullifex sp.]
MFVGRKKELAQLEELYASSRFEFLVLYGRRRVGKTELLKEFSARRNALFYSAKEQNDALNLSDFSFCVQTFFDGTSFGSFTGWDAVLKYIAARSGDERLLIVIDEFPYIAAANPSVKSILQHVIDHGWKNKNIFLILCGSSVSFMESDVLGAKSPLYGRATAHLEIKGFDYLESSLFFPGYTNTEKLMAYGILGGIPCYLQTFDPEKTIERNIAHEILREGSFLKDEPLFLLKQELREPAVYNSILEAIATGASRLNEIATAIHEDVTKCSKYLGVLQTLRLVKKSVPCTEDGTSKRSIYGIADNFLTFWFRFLFRNRSYYELLGPEEAARMIMEPKSFSAYFGFVFENICLEYMIRMAKRRRLPFIPYSYGKWWGNNPERKCQDDIDILMTDMTKSRVIICECKYREDAFGKDEMETMLQRASIFPNADEVSYYAFSKGGFTDYVKDNAGVNNIRLVTIDDLFVMEAEN